MVELDLVQRLVRQPAPWTVRLIAYAAYLSVPVWAARLPGSGKDDMFVVRAAREVLDGVSPYTDRRFLYPPSSVPFAFVLAPLSDRTVQHLVPVTFAALLLAGWWAVLRLFDVRFAAWLATVPIMAAPLFAPLVNAIVLGSWTLPVAALSCVALLLMGKGRWVAAGAVVGLSIAVKPMLVPLGLIFLLGRRWSGFLLAAGIPAAAGGVMLAFIAEPGRFFTDTVPFLLGGQDGYSHAFDASLPAILPRLGFDQPIVAVLRAAFAIVTVSAAVLRWRRPGGDERLRVVEASSVLMIGTFLVLTPGFDHYVLLVLPALLASAATAGSVVATVWFWLALFPQTGAVRIQEFDSFQRRAFKDHFMFLVLWAGLLAQIAIDRRRTAAVAAMANAATPDPPADPAAQEPSPVSTDPIPDLTNSSDGRTR